MKTGKEPKNVKGSNRHPVNEREGMERPGKQKVSGALGRVQSLFGSLVDGTSLAVFRIGFGAMILLEAVTHLLPSKTTGGRIPLEVYYTDPAISFHFPYEGFQWLPMLPQTGIYFVLALMAFGGIALALGFYYRAAAVSVFLSWGYLYAVESTRTYWISHYYLVLLASFLLIWLPGAATWSVDAKRAGRRNKEAVMIPFWPILLLRAQLVITYVYAGVAKLNADWLLNAQPVRYFLSQDHLLAPYRGILGPGLTKWAEGILQSEGLAYFISYAGAGFDLSVGFLLLWRRTRALGMVLMMGFHLTNHFLIFDDIGWFPFVGVVTAMIFLSPDWPRRFWKWLLSPKWPKLDRNWAISGLILLPVVGFALGWKRRETLVSLPGARLHVWVIPCCILWVALQVLLPLRHYVIAGDSRITHEGLCFSWRLKAEVYRTMPCEIKLRDPEFATLDPNLLARVNWEKWRGEKVLYRLVDPKRIDLRDLPEVFITKESIVGERILYNPYADRDEPMTETECRRRIKEIWGELYGRPPELVQRIVPLAQILDGYMKSLQRRSIESADRQEALEMLRRMHGSEGDGSMLPVLRRMQPFGLLGASHNQASFMLIEDPALVAPNARLEYRIDRAAWKNNKATISRIDAPIADGETREGLIFHTVIDSQQKRAKYPKAILIDSLVQSAKPPEISWDYRQDLTTSQSMHVSMQPMLLRRYAVHIADEWEGQYGSRPEVHAATAVSLNFRPLQTVVDPDVDLARVPFARLRHNDWISDLENLEGSDSSAQNFIMPLQ